MELLITMTLLAIITLIVSQALWLGTRAWEKGEARVEATQSPRVVLGLVKDQISSAMVYRIRKDGVSYPLFIGAEDQLQFVSVVSLHPAQRGGLFRVLYRMAKNKAGQETLQFFEENLAITDPTKDIPADAGGWRTLADGLQDVSFQYAAVPGKDGQITWQDTWDGRELKSIPALVKISISAKGEDQPFSQVMQLPAATEWDDGVKEYKVS
jgi:type II secretory pathway component PulJ